MTPELDRNDPDYLAKIRTAYFNLYEHVRDVHGIDARGSAGQIEYVHTRAHTVEGTPWHDAWRLPEPGEQLR